MSIDSVSTSLSSRYDIAQDDPATDTANEQNQVQNTASKNDIAAAADLLESLSSLLGALISKMIDMFSSQTDSESLSTSASQEENVASSETTNARLADMTGGHTELPLEAADEPPAVPAGPESSDIAGPVQENEFIDNSLSSLASDIVPLNTSLVSEASPLWNAQSYTDRAFEKLDQDADGKLSLPEYRNQAPDLADRFGKIDTDANGLVTQQELIQEKMPDMDEINQNADRYLQDHDTNSDGKISFEEFSMSGYYSYKPIGIIDAADEFPMPADGSTAVDATDAAYSTDYPDSETIIEDVVDGESIGLSEYWDRQNFKNADKDADGYLSRTEIVDDFTPYIPSQEIMERWADAEINRVDQNGDGNLSLDEYYAPTDLNFNSIDTDNDAYITKQEMQDELEYTSKPSSKELDKMDTDKDGLVSEQEFLAYQTNAFKILDANNDGFISEAERKSGPQLYYNGDVVYADNGVIAISQVADASVAPVPDDVDVYPVQEYDQSDVPVSGSSGQTLAADTVTPVHNIINTGGGDDIVVI